MDIFAIFFLSCVSVLFGIILTLVVQYYILYEYFKKSPVAKTPAKHNSVDYSLPEALKKKLESENLNSQENSTVLPVSLILQFLFHELRHSEAVKRWFYKKLSLEFDELLTKTTIGKFFEVINIKDMHLGNQFPDIKSIIVEDVKLDKKLGHIETINLCLNLDYTGNFLLCIDAKMKFGKTAYLSIKVKRVSGMVRLQFTRNPYTHWSFSFYTEPVMDLAVESHFQGRQLQSNITNLIVNQIKKAIRRKHTLPNYKIRYKPFFNKTDPSQLDLEENEIVPQGILEVNCAELTRLAVASDIENIYYTIAIDTIPWTCIVQKDDSTFMTLEITMTKLRQSQLGVAFKQEQNTVIIDSVSPHSSAFRSGLKPGDIVLSVENRSVTAVPQVAKLIKSSSGTNVTLRIERLVDNYVIRSPKNPDLLESKSASLNLEGSEDEFLQSEQDSFVFVENSRKEPDKKAKSPVSKTPERSLKSIANNENMSKFAQTIGNFTLRKRKASVSDRASNESSARNTPTSSGPGTPQHTTLKQAITIPNLLLTKKHSIPEVPEIVRTDAETAENEMTEVIEVYKSKLVAPSTALSFNNDYRFHLKEGHKYLNMNVWGVSSDNKEILLGYVNIPLTHILNECCSSVLGHYMRTYSFLPPTNAAPTNQTHPLLSHSGFEHVFCYGDVLLVLIWSNYEEIELKRRMSSQLAVILNNESKMTESTPKHDFIRTQFHRTTHCDFCSKKIWLKDAVQCRECGLCCHKKCIVKCQLSTGCNPKDKSNLKNEVTDLVNPEITMTEVCDEMTEIEGKTSSPLKRVNSVNNLSIPGMQMSTLMSKSLPPSPQRSRKQSLANMNPFVMCPNVLEEIRKPNCDTDEQISKLLEQVMLCPADEYLMDIAKESGQQMYATMSHEEKVEKINFMMTELKKKLDLVTSEHTELSRQMNNEESEVEKTKVAFLMGQADAKVHALSVLMLHYCSSLQHTQEKIV